MMMEWRRLEIKTGIISFPDVSVNGMKHAELLTAESTYEKICSTLFEGTQGCVDESTGNQNNKGAIIAAVVISTIALVLTGICCYRKVIRQ